MSSILKPQQFTAKLSAGVPVAGPAGPQGPPGPPATLGFGRILSDGTAYANSGWTCSHTVTGTYVVTHNLNMDPRTYVVLVCPGDNTPGRAAPQSSMVLVVTQQALNSFTIQVIDGSNMNPIDGAFNFGVFQ